MGLMNRAIDLLKRQARSAPNESLLEKAISLRQEISDADPVEEVLVQIIQAIPGLPEGFAGLYQAFHLIRDLLAFDKLLLLSPGESSPQVLEPLISYGFDETSRTRFNIERSLIPDDIRHARLEPEDLVGLSDRDRESLAPSVALMVLGRPEFLCLLIGSGHYTKIEGVPVFGPVVQVLNLHLERFFRVLGPDSLLGLVDSQSLRAPLGPEDVLIRLRMDEFSSRFQEQYPDVPEYRGRGLALELVRSFLPGESRISLEGDVLLVHVPAHLPAVQRSVGGLLQKRLESSFQLQSKEPLIEFLHPASS